MITCEAFRVAFQPATEEPAILAHLRACDPCLDHAAQIDPDVMFRAIGGAEVVPPGGVDAFVDDVMREVRLRGTENRMATPRVLSWPQRWAIAATIAAGISGALLVYEMDKAETPMGVARATFASAPVKTANLTVRPAVERYESDNATIVEVPAGEANDVKIVMVFDENLPADL
jgi:hypothetical protein